MRQRTTTCGFGGRPCCHVVAAWTVVLWCGGAGTASAQPGGKAGPVPPGMMAAPASDRLEAALDRFFAESDEARRRAIFDEELSPNGVGLTWDELAAMGKAGGAGGAGRAGVTRVPSPWLKDDRRGWFNLTLPSGYTPKKAWPLVVALHGAGGTGDHVAGMYGGPMSKAGFIVVSPTTSDAKQYWSTNEQLANVYRVIDWVVRRYRVDMRRLTVSGQSMGGVGTWSHVMLMPGVWSAGAAAAGHPGDLQESAVDRLRSVKLYLLHGDKDRAVSVEWARKASAALTKRRVEHVYVEAKGAGHMAPPAEWAKMMAWLAAQPPKPWSPRPVLLPGEGGRLLWQAVGDPLGLRSLGQPVMVLLDEGKVTEARGAAAKLVRGSRGDARAQAVLAIAQLPGLRDPLPESLRPQDFDRKTWNRAAEQSAQNALQAALRLKAGKAPVEAGFDAEVHMMLARLWAKRFAMVVDQRSRTLVTYYNNYVRHINMVQRLNPAHGGIYAIAKKMNARMPKGRVQLK